MLVCCLIYFGIFCTLRHVRRQTYMCTHIQNQSAIPCVSINKNNYEFINERPWAWRDVGSGNERLISCSSCLNTRGIHHAELKLQANQIWFVSNSTAKSLTWKNDRLPKLCPTHKLLEVMGFFVYMPWRANCDCGGPPDQNCSGAELIRHLFKSFSYTWELILSTEKGKW